MTTDITELAHGNSLRKKLNRRLNDAYGFQRTSGGKHTTISLSIAECKSVIAALDERLALVEALEKAQATEAHCNRGWFEAHEQEARAEAAEQRIAELENNEIQEEGNQFLVVRHPDKVPVIKHPVGELEDYLRQIFKADPLATIDIVTHRYYGVGGQFVKDADEYLHEMSIKVEAE
ncbi:ead/Ea22-like family protein [Klebsiella quasipneumoniae]|uniref:ead/Ea22-like family protein n=1 Tax=Klebsiella quasipneumoniae TaxID=1463165 RepID=UPI002882FFD4|nr:ead/Ea22-like family protein [Klebsiella quasipneumoniae]